MSQDNIIEIFNLNDNVLLRYNVNSKKFIISAERHYIPLDKEVFEALVLDYLASEDTGLAQRFSDLVR